MMGPDMLRIARKSRSIATFVGISALVCGASACKTQPTPTPMGSSSTPLASSAPPTKPANALPITSAAVMAAVNPNGLPPYSGPTGTVEGTIFVTGDPAPPQMGKSFDGCPAAAAVYGKQFREGAPLRDGKRPLADAMVGITGYSGFYLPEAHESQRVTIDNCAYSQRTVVLTLGQALEVLNLTQESFAPELENEPAPALMMAAPKSDPVKLYPTKLGRYRVIERTSHQWMEIDVFVIGHRLHAVTDTSGHYRIDNVPVGKLTVGALHPFIEISSDGGAPQQDVRKDVDVQAGIVTKVDLTIPYAKVAPRPRSLDRAPVLP